MRPAWSKTAFLVQLLVVSVFLGGCSTNPATGEKQFTALMPPGQEAAIGAEQHQHVEAEFGKFIQGPVASYVERVGQRVAAQTERSDVQYKFHVVDSPVVNAFAIPGGYIYVTRGLLTLANSEAELAGVLAHEIGHITGRHAAARTSQGALVGIGAAIISAAIGNSAVSQVANIGSDLYIKSYSRGQENEADTLGVRYLSRAGYDTRAMAGFLASLQAESQLQAKIAGREDGTLPEYFSTHPLTQDRVVAAGAQAGNYPPGGDINRESYLAMVDGLVYGDSAEQGFVKGNTFYHPQMGFKFSVPDGCPIINTPQQVIAQCGDGSIIAFDAAGDSQNRDPYSFLTQVWASGKPLENAESIEVNGYRGATGSAQGTVNGRAMRLQMVAIEWQKGQFFRFLIGMPQNVSSASVDALKRATYSFGAITTAEKSSLRPAQVKVFTAKAGDTVQSIASRMGGQNYAAERIQVLNGLRAGEGFIPGRKYKMISP